MPSLVILIHNIRSCFNVGSILRTAEGLGATKVILTGYTPYPRMTKDTRLPHLAAKIDKQISKTSLGAEKSLAWRHASEILPVITELKTSGYTVAALEQTKNSINLASFKPPKKLAIIVGREVEGIEPEVIEKCDLALEIPMAGQKESFNVASAAAMALYHCQLTSK